MFSCNHKPKDCNNHIYEIQWDNSKIIVLQHFKTTHSRVKMAFESIKNQIS